MLTEVEHLSCLLQITLSFALVKYKPCNLQKTNKRSDGLRKWGFVAWDRNSSTNLKVWRKKELKCKTNCQVAKETVYILPVIIKKNIAHALLKRKVNLVLMNTAHSSLCWLRRMQSPIYPWNRFSSNSWFLLLARNSSRPLQQQQNQSCQLSWQPALACNNVSKIITT